METTTPSKFITAAIIAVVAVGAVAWWAGYQSGWNKAKLAVQNAGILPPSASETQVTNFSGKVLSVNGQKLDLKIVSVDPFAPKDLEVRTVVADQSTVIERLSMKDQAAFQKELDAFNKQVQAKGGAANVSPGEYPNPFITETIQMSDIKTDDIVTVMSNENIANAKSFTASKISVQIAITPPPSSIPVNATNTLPVPPATTR